MLRRSFINKVKILDLHPKTSEDIKEKSSAGAIVTFFGYFLLVLLLLNEIGEYLVPKHVEFITVKHETRGETMKIQFKILFLELPCTAINFDVSDKLGTEFVGMNETIMKKQFIGDFSNLKAFVKKDEWIFLNTRSRIWKALRKHSLGMNLPDRCLSCHEAEQKGKKLGDKHVNNMCCNNCFELKEAYADAGLDPAGALQYEQCQGEQEGCLTEGYISVNKVL